MPDLTSKALGSDESRADSGTNRQRQRPPTQVSPVARPISSHSLSSLPELEIATVVENQKLMEISRVGKGRGRGISSLLVVCHEAQRMPLVLPSMAIRVTSWRP